MTDPAKLELPVAPRSSRLRKYVRIFRVSLVERMVYRLDFLLTTVLRFLPMLTTILLWQAIFAGASADGADEKRMAGFTEREMIAYLLLVHIGRIFSSMPGLAGGIARDIRDGSLKKYLLQPIDLLAYLLAYRVAHKVAYIAASALPYALLFYLCGSFFDAPPDAGTLAAFALSLLLGFAIGFAWEACMGMIGFWFLEVSSLLYVVNTLNFFVSGQMFPLDLLEQQSPLAVRLLKLLPFQYLAYFPTAVYLRKVQGADLFWGLILEAAWAVGFLLLARGLYRLGLRRYGAYGG